MTRRARRIGAGLLVLALLALTCVAVALAVLQKQGITPRALAPYVAKRSAGHNAVITGTGEWLAATLLRLDRGSSVALAPLMPGVGARQQAVPAPLAGTVRPVTSSDQARQAIAEAQPGDVITFLPGTYRIERAAFNAHRAGTELANIVVRAVQPGSVIIEVDGAVGFAVSAPWWRFENLLMKGVCKMQAFCEHAFHVTGAASHFKAINNTLLDFNAQFKVNGVQGRFPDHGRIEFNTLRNDSVRATTSPVTPIDLVAGSHWRIRHNLIADFIKGSGDRISYGAFAKGAGSGNVIEQNAVLCEASLRGQPGQRVGLSLGGGGTGKPYCRDGRCIVEQEKSEIRANLVASCSDDGIYLNNAAASTISHNTLVDTGGVQLRFAGTSADVVGNLVDGDIRVRNGADLRLGDNLYTPVYWLYLGRHPQRNLFKHAAAFDFSWDGAPPRRERGAAFVPDLCRVQRGPSLAYGAFDDIATCAARAQSD